MCRKLFKHVHEFISKRSPITGPLLLGLSGGPDSMALLYLLLESRDRCSFPLVLVHIDHGWREESADEAKELSLLAEKLEVAIEIKRLEQNFSSSNLEARAREARLNFFLELYEKHQACALLLAHQKDDLVETTFKKVCEGAGLSGVHNLKEESVYREMKIWRPLLKFDKEELIDYCSEKGCQPFQDPTNNDVRFLRGKLRSDLIPSLENSFGKNVSENFVLLAQESEEMDRFLQKRIEAYLEAIKNIEGKISLDLNPLPKLEMIELRYLLRSLIKMKCGFLSREQIDQAARHLLLGSQMKRFQSGQSDLLVHCGRIQLN